MKPLDVRLEALEHVLLEINVGDMVLDLDEDLWVGIGHCLCPPDSLFCAGDVVLEGRRLLRDFGETEKTTVVLAHEGLEDLCHSSVVRILRLSTT